MWISQRTGRNTAVSFRFGAVVFAVLALGGVTANALQDAPWGLWVFLALIGAGLIKFVLWQNRLSRVRRAEQEALEELAEAERLERIRALRTQVRRR